VVRVFCKDLLPPHDKYCICICPNTGLFLYVNSEQPAAKKARAVVLEIGNFEATFLSHTSYIDTTRLEPINLDDRVVEALKDAKRLYGYISPSLKRKIIEAVVGHGALPEGQEAILLAGETLPQ
jgi:hypothetical protein